MARMDTATRAATRPAIRTSVTGTDDAAIAASTSTAAAGQANCGRPEKPCGRTCSSHTEIRKTATGTATAALATAVGVWPTCDSWSTAVASPAPTAAAEEKMR
jgi:hypothetical protein